MFGLGRGVESVNEGDVGFGAGIGRVVGVQ